MKLVMITILSWVAGIGIGQYGRENNWSFGKKLLTSAFVGALIGLVGNFIFV